MAWRLVRQMSTNRWLAVVHGAVNPAHLGSDAAYVEDLSAGFGIPAADLAVYRGAGDWQFLIEAIHGRNAVPPLEAQYPVCVGLVPPPTSRIPEVAPFVAALKVAFPRKRLNELARNYPLAIPALQAGDFQGFKTDVDDAASGLTPLLTAAEKATLYTLAQVHHIPGF